MKKALQLVALMLIAVPFKAMTETPRSDTYGCSRTQAAESEAAEGVMIQPSSPASAPLQRPYRYGPDHRTDFLI
ncbi:hypothetical protein [Aliiroseovarius crassostreae]|uniref:hypothetical protein n=1 Tax=Aliiroseovarius crassostreae TaxID=154981 RepID=UPI003C7AACD7